jgi:hypothetical protein
MEEHRIQMDGVWSITSVICTSTWRERELGTWDHSTLDFDVMCLLSVIIAATTDDDWESGQLYYERAESLITLPPLCTTSWLWTGDVEAQSLQREMQTWQEKRKRQPFFPFSF